MAMVRTLWLVLSLAACGRWNFDHAADASIDACVTGAVCTPATAVCWTGIADCTDSCAASTPLDATGCPGGTCASGVCLGAASAPLDHPAAGTNAYFGASVDSDGQRIVVGAPQANAAYVVEPAGASWVVTATLTSTWGPAASLFGAAVAIDGDRIVVGSRYSRGPGMTPVSGAGGAIVIYERNVALDTWTEVGQVLGPDGGEFGNALALRGNRIVVGAEYADTVPMGYGSAYIVEGSGSVWATVATLAAPTADRLGHFVQLSGDRVAIGSLWDPGPVSTETGAVRIWERSTSGAWSLAQVLQPDDTRPDAFGQGFSLDGDRLAVGVPWFADGDRGTGAVYVYDRDPSGVWQTAGPILPSIPQRDGNLGRGIVVRGDRLFATAADWNAAGAVTTHIYRRQPDGRWLEVG